MPKLSCVLLVDDDQTTNYLSQLLLKRLDVAEKVVVALNGKEALELLDEHYPGTCVERPMLILLDVKMPVMDGFAFLQAFEQLDLPEKESIAVVMLTTSLHPQDVERVKQLNIAGYLNKPLTEAKIRDILAGNFN